MSDIKAKVQGLDPNVQPRDVLELVAKTGNIYESIAIISKRDREFVLWIVLRLEAQHLGTRWAGFEDVNICDK